MEIEMNNILRIALCGLSEEEKQEQNKELPKEVKEESAEEKTITMTGPLSDVFSRALQIVFAKKKLEVSTESQANDALMAMAAARANANIDNQLNDGAATLAKKIESNVLEVTIPEYANVYAVDSDSFTPETPIKASIAMDTANNKKRNIIVVDYPGEDADKVLMSENGIRLEQYCAKLNIKLVYGLESLLIELRK
jgi:hypothetical protein